MFFHVFAQTTHVVAGPRGFTCDPAIYSKFHRNPFRGFGAAGGQNLAFPIPLSSRFYNSMYYRTNRDLITVASRIWLVPQDLKWFTFSLRDLTTPLSETICLPWARHCYGQRTFRIWSLYLNLLRRYEKGYKMWKRGWFAVIRGHRRSQRHSIERIKVTISLP